MAAEKKGDVIEQANKILELYKKDNTLGIPLNEINARNFVLALVKTRREKGISQTELAKMTGINQSTISRFENLSIQPTLNIVFKILEALDCYITLSHNENSNSMPS